MTEQNARILSRIEALVAEIEHLTVETGGQYREAADREAFDIVSRIERQMQQRQRG